MLCWLSSKEPTCNAGATGDAGSIPGSRISPGRKKWQLTPVFLLENPMDRGAWQALVLGVTKSRTHASSGKAHFSDTMKAFFLVKVELAEFSALHIMFTSSQPLCCLPSTSTSGWFENYPWHSLVVQWLRLWAPNAGGLGSTPSQGTKCLHSATKRFCVLQLRPSTAEKQTKKTKKRKLPLYLHMSRKGSWSISPWIKKCIQVRRYSEYYWHINHFWGNGYRSLQEKS